MQNACKNIYNRTELQYTNLTSVKHKIKHRLYYKINKLNKILLTQKLLGLILIALSIYITKLLSDATAAVILIPLAIYLLITKDEILKR